MPPQGIATQIGLFIYFLQASQGKDKRQGA